jgi:hypothetical protein
MLGLALILAAAQAMPHADEVRVREFYRFAIRTQDRVWPGWSKTPAPLLLVTKDAEFLTHFPSPPADFTRISDVFFARPRHFAASFQATFPAFGLPATIVIGEPAATESKTSTPWLIVVMHEHFHQLQWSRPGYLEGVEALGLARGDKTGMWMLNYPFPYERPDVARGFAELRDALLAGAPDYAERRRRFFGQLAPDDAKYLEFQLWQEGIARYTQVACAEAGADYRPTGAFAALPDYTPFAAEAATARRRTLDELKRADLASWKRNVVYSFGAAEGFLLDRVSPDWKQRYFERPFTLAPEFQPR